MQRFKITLPIFGFLLVFPFSMCWCEQVSAQGDQLVTDAELYKFRTSVFFRLARGDLIYSEKDHKDLVVTNSKGYVYQVTMKAKQKKPGELHDLHEQFENDMVSYVLDSRYAQKNKLFRDAFVKELIDRFDYAFTKLPLSEDRISFVNLALMLPTLGKTGDPRVGAYLNQLLQKGDNDIIKLFAMKALQEQLANDLPQVKAFMENDVRMKVVERLEPLMKYLTDPPKYLESGTPAQIGGYQYIRCEAIQALGETRLPGVPLLPGLDGKIHAPVAFLLAKALSNEKSQLSPPSSLEEKIEAAIGLCKMDAAKIPRYQAQLGFFLVGNFVVDFTTQFAIDKARFNRAQTKTLPNDKSVSIRIPPRISWKLHSARLLLALDELERNTPPNAKLQQKYVGVLQTARSLLTKIKDGNQFEAPTLLRNQVNEIRPDSGLVYEKSEYQIELP